jgi:hypothetical protein
VKVSLVKPSGVVAGDSQPGGLFETRFGEQHPVRKGTKLLDCFRAQGPLVQHSGNAIRGVPCFT